eukprot:SAG11_NODE_32319_length_284_cov_1.394595_1_plen_64_part_01
MIMIRSLSGFTTFGVNPARGRRPRSPMRSLPLALPLALAAAAARVAAAAQYAYPFLNPTLSDEA